MKISIITVVYNNLNTIEKTIQSVLNQTYDCIEYLIIDGNSTDGTGKILDKYSHEIDVLVSEKDDGIYHALNKGIELATGDIIGILNADDEYTDSNVLEKVYNVFEEKRCDAVYGDLVYTNFKTSKVIRRWKSKKFNKEKFQMGWMPPHPTFFVKKIILKKFGLYDESFEIAADYELMLRLLYKHQIDVEYLSEALIKMRMGGVSNSWKNKVKIFIEDYKAWKINELKPRFYTIPLKKLSKFKQYL